jgi:hypothetical protein
MNPMDNLITHTADCTMVTTHHLTCSCGAVGRSPGNDVSPDYGALAKMLAPHLAIEAIAVKPGETLVIRVDPLAVTEQELGHFNTVLADRLPENAKFLIVAAEQLAVAHADEE